MPSIMTRTYRYHKDHYPPKDIDSQEERHLRGQLELIDYTTDVANREIISSILVKFTTADFEKMAARTAQARARWIVESLRIPLTVSTATTDDITRLAAARMAYEEMAKAYEGMRRMLERGYLTLS